MFTFHNTNAPNLYVSFLYILEQSPYDLKMGENMLSILPYSDATCASFLAVPRRFI
jgi:hypothetical protein